MNQEKPVVLIMAGGKGERFWPRSRISTPKQLQKVYSKNTLLKETLNRALTITTLDRIFIGTNATLKKAILEQEKHFPEKNFIIEPEGKNTAPIIALASLYFKEKFGDPVQVVLSADAWINPEKEFTKTIQKALAETKEHLVLLGIKPSRPEVGYGYIAAGKATKSGFEVKSFFEKPDSKTARKYIKKSNFYWNPGIFLWRTSLILEEFQSHSPKILKPLADRFPFKKAGELNEAFKLLSSEPIDIAIMEKSSRIRMVEASFGWDDVGSWLSLERVMPGDSKGNRHMGKEILYFHSSDNITQTRKEFTALLGVKDLIVVEEDDVLFIASKEGVSDIKNLVAEIRKNKSLQKYTE
ncbi:mannose-1-phosphate guanylyltransferase [Leptospira perolatii]|uniref:mannose-1-phosphate guanylyltransferase n=1 Tax=Leptospira perolatii TaxID=2023191 RepID=A0A2M9ZQF2_9LEPT|nr:sugar phosphate nucleotidyltransferase [Leptospira perolatii]PJZ68053.1 mannose-1-phosphate guanylyltransferase [Leptospira perolatii]PJZ74201.1 mannose-1-phosphate guanylyltransferase [Leptospira perolatii]